MSHCDTHECPLKDMYHLVDFDRVDNEKENRDYWYLMHRTALKEGSSWDSE